MREPIQETEQHTEVDGAHGVVHNLMNVFGTGTILIIILVGAWIIWKKKIQGLIK